MPVVLVVPLVLLAAYSLPLGYAIWRVWKKMRPRALAIQYQNQQAFLDRLGEGLGSFGFNRQDGGATQVVFEPTGLQKSVGVMIVTVNLRVPGQAQITCSGAFARHIRRIFPDAQYEPYAGPSPLGGIVKGVAKVFAGLLLATIVVGGIAYLGYQATR